MTKPDPNANPAKWREEIASLRAEVTELASSRVQLAQLELAQTAKSSKRWAVLAGGCAVIATAGVTLLLAVCGEELAVRYGGSPGLWKASIGLGGLALGCIGLLWLSRRIRRGFRPFSLTLAELREDAAWLREWLG